MKKVLFFLITVTAAHLPLAAQQVARARYVQLVTTSSPTDTLNITSKGGISFIGSTRLVQHGHLTLLSNPVSGNADWLDSTTGVISASSTGMVNFKGVTNLQNITGPTTFYGLTIDGIGVNLNQSNEVSNRLNLSNGLIYIPDPDDSIYVSNPALAAIGYTTDPYATTSWVHGKLSRRLNVTSLAYEFPVGKIDSDSLYAPVKLLKQTTGPSTYSVQYFPDMPVNRTSINPFFHHISSVEYWHISSHNYAVPADNYAKLSLSWRTYSDVSSSPVHWDSLMIAHYIYPGGAQPFLWEPEFVSPLAVIELGATVNFGYFTNEKFIGDYSMPHLNFTIGTRTVNNALPVTLLDYQVELTGNQDVLNTWKVVNDTRVARYEVERSADNNSFAVLGNVASSRSSGISQYTYTDQQPFRGWNYYRLKIFEDNGVRYSPTRKVFIGATNLFTLYPNPASDYIYVVLPAAADSRSSLSLIDNSGRIIYTQVPQSTTVRLTLTKLPAGVYHVRYQSGENVYSRSFIHQ